MTRLLRGTAIGLILSIVAPLGNVEVFVYATARAEAQSVPDWIQATCCGPQDAHKLRVDQIQRRDDGWYLADGYKAAINPSIVKPSQDGFYWLFYRDDGVNGQSGVYCFFEPVSI